MNKEVPLYLKNDVQEVWIVDPETKELYQYLAGKDKNPSSYTNNDKITSHRKILVECRLVMDY